MTAPSSSSSLDATALDPRTEAVVRGAMPPDARELGSLAATAAVVAIAHAADAGERLLADRLPTVWTDATTVDALLVVAVQFMPWLLGLVVLSALYALGWLPRAHERLLEPSLIASWIAVFVGAGAAWVAGSFGLWPWTWTSTSPETATQLARFVSGEQWIALGAWLALACVLVPLLSELFFRLALLEWLHARGSSPMVAIGLSAATFGVVWLAAGWSASPDAALRHALVAAVAGVALGVTAVRGSRGRGLGLCVVAYGAWLGTEHWMLLRALLTG